MYPFKIDQRSQRTGEQQGGTFHVAQAVNEAWHKHMFTKLFFAKGYDNSSYPGE